MDIDQVLPQVYVGSCPISTGEIELLGRQFRVTAVLNVQTDEDMTYWGIDWDELSGGYRASGMEVRRVPVRDFDPEDLRRRLPDCVRALDELVRAGHIVYVHCSAGKNRSPSTVVAYLHWVVGWDFDAAAAHVTAHRRCEPYFESIRAATEDRASGPASD